MTRVSMYPPLLRSAVEITPVNLLSIERTGIEKLYLEVVPGI